MRVLGVDPGSRFLGFGVVDEQRGQLRHLGHGVVKTRADAALELRLAQIYEELSAAVRVYKPQAIAVEGVFSFKNARSALILGHARGVALLVAAQQGLSVAEYSPAKIKRSVGAGGADGKDAVAQMVGRWLKLPPLERHDAYDALAVAICHCNHSKSPTKGVLGAKGPASFFDRLTPNYGPARARAVNLK